MTREEIYELFLSALECIDDDISYTPFDTQYLDGLLESYKNGMSRRQVLISFNKWVHGFNTSRADIDIRMMRDEYDEVVVAWQQETPDRVAEELADVAIYCYGIAHMLGVNLDDVIEKKMEYNIRRVYDSDKLL